MKATTAVIDGFIIYLVASSVDPSIGWKFFLVLIVANVAILIAMIADKKRESEQA